MMKKIFAALVVLAFVAPVASAHAVNQSVEADGETYYVHADESGDHIGVFQETNGCDGLQVDGTTEADLDCDANGDGDLDDLVEADEAVAETGHL